MTAIDLTFQKFPGHNGVFVLRNIEEFMIEFAKYHVEQALKAAANNYINAKSGSLVDIILQSYPLTNIK